VKDAPENDYDTLPDEANVTSGEKPKILSLPTKHKPINVTIYGQMCTNAKSYQSAMSMLSVINTPFRRP
jgi:hypothetical protein